ncbi:plasmid pRiA4b ORF-3 family protein [Salininema proteolyticum]|uniref:Plasmid pRiA4b ORF-3 family protein n=1 Tax=Salininema proteolyticum TaxID=1607685 RepID=A0ABV8U1P7_9ACTN
MAGNRRRRDKPVRWIRQRHSPVDEIIPVLDRRLLDLIGAERDPLKAETMILNVLMPMLSLGRPLDYLETVTLNDHLNNHLSPEAAAVLTALADMGSAESREDTRAGVEAFEYYGVFAPEWAPELRHPPRFLDAAEYLIGGSPLRLLSVTFLRNGTPHLFLLTIDTEDCGAIRDFETAHGDDEVEEVLDALDQGREHRPGVPVEPRELKKEEAALYLSSALETTIAHRGGGGWDQLSATAPDDPYLPLHLNLLVTRMNQAGLGRAGREHGEHLEGGRPGTAPEEHRSDRTWESIRERNAVLRPVDTVFRIRADIRKAKPPIWRRLEVPADTRLSDLHRILQAAFGWTDTHLWEFDIGASSYSDCGLDGVPSASGEVLGRLVGEGETFHYTYDFGDSWEVVLSVEKVVDAEPDSVYPRCTAGRRPAPLEDTGGIGVWCLVLDVLEGKAPTGAEAELAEWGVDAVRAIVPRQFDRRAINEGLAPLRRQ